MSWYEQKWSLPLRIPLSFVTWKLWFLRNQAYNRGLFKAASVGIPVISVGNLSVGGTGKTLVVEALGNHLRESGHTPGILSRGYGRKSKGLQVVSDGYRIQIPVGSSGDEPMLLARQLPGCPVVVSEDRRPGAVKLVEEFKVDCILLDDGFQHRRLHRDLDIVLLDPAVYEAPHLLPWGRMREPLSALKRADQVLFSKGAGTGDAQRLKLVYPEHLLDPQGQAVLPGNLPSPLGAFCGLGNPRFFFHAVSREVGPPLVKIAFPDHCAYSDQALGRLEEKRMATWITTAKDAVKLSAETRSRMGIHVLPVKAELPHSLLQAVEGLFRD